MFFGRAQIGDEMQLWGQFSKGGDEPGHLRCSANMKKMLGTEDDHARVVFFNLVFDLSPSISPGLRDLAVRSAKGFAQAGPQGVCRTEVTHKRLVVSKFQTLRIKNTMAAKLIATLKKR